MLHDLYTNRSARFLRRLHALPQAGIEAYFDDVIAHRDNAAEVERVVKRVTTVAGSRLRLSYLLFRFREEPAFLQGTAYEDTRHGYVLLAELPVTLAVFTRHAPFSDGLFAQSVDPLPFDIVSRLFVDGQSEYERISVRNMTVSEYELRRAAYEARNLQNVLSNIVVGRTIPQSLRVRNTAQTVLLTPSTSRVGTLGGRLEFRPLLQWCLRVDQAISGFVPVNSFLDSFATPVPVQTPPGVAPTGLLLFLDDLERDVLEDHEVSIWRKGNNGLAHELDEGQAISIFRRFQSVLEVRQQPDGSFAVLKDTARPFAKLVVTSSTITIRSKQLDRFELRRPGSEPESLTKYLNSTQEFIVNYNDPRSAYFNRQRFEDRSQLGNIPHFLEILEPDVGLVQVTSEKGTPLQADTEFPPQSVFRSVEVKVRGMNVDILFCDDIDDEWADHIAVWENPRRIAYIHSKFHATVGLSASAFQEVVGQGLKNLARLRSRRNEYLQKIQARWTQQYVTKDGTQTSIERTRNGVGTANQLADRVMSVSTSPSATREVWLVTNWISRANVTIVLSNLAANQQGARHEIQLLWLLSSFVTGCQGAGLIPKIICQP